MKKILFFIIISCLFVRSSFAAEFTDVKPDHPNQVAIEYLTEIDILKGQGNGISFGPRLLLNRAEWAIVLMRMENIEIDESSYQNCFPDVTTEWFAPAVCYAVEQEWIKGYQSGPEAGRFISTNPLNLAELLVMLERFLGWDVEEGQYWYSGALNYAIGANMVDEKMSFDHQVTRAEAAEILFRALVLEDYLLDIYDPFLGEEALREVKGGSTATAPNADFIGPIIPVYLRPFPDQPKHSNVLSGATYVPVLRFILESQQNVTLSELTVRKRAASLTRDIVNTRLIINGKVVRESTFASSDPLASWRALNQPITSATPLLVEINVDFRQAPAEEFVFQSFQFEVSPNLIVLKEASAAVQGDAVSGLQFNTSPLMASTVTIRNPETKLKLPTILSEKEVIARFTIEAGERDVALRRLRLEDAESLNARHFSNFRLVAGSQEVGFIEAMKNNVLDFNISDYHLEAGEDRSFKVLADIQEPSLTDHIRLYLEDADDLQAVELEFGYGAQVKNQFSRNLAWCVGAEEVQCTGDELRRKCGREEREAGVRGCEEEETIKTENTIPTECDDRLAPVCGSLDDIPQTFSNRCKAEMAQAKNIQVGPCP